MSECNEPGCLPEENSSSPLCLPRYAIPACCGPGPILEWYPSQPLEQLHLALNFFYWPPALLASPLNFSTVYREDNFADIWIEGE